MVCTQQVLAVSKKNNRSQLPSALPSSSFSPSHDNNSAKEVHPFPSLLKYNDAVSYRVFRKNHWVFKELLRVPSEPPVDWRGTRPRAPGLRLRGLSGLNRRNTAPPCRSQQPGPQDCCSVISTSPLLFSVQEQQEQKPGWGPRTGDGQVWIRVLCLGVWDEGRELGECFLLVSVVILPCGPKHSSDGFKSINQSRLFSLLPAWCHFLFSLISEMALYRTPQRLERTNPPSL